jgi:hypothetical protein
MRILVPVFLLVPLAMFTMVPPPAPADEGMWLFNAPPVEQLKSKYDFEATPEWMLHLQRSSVRFNSGGSGSFVSSNGLVMTNHHVGADALQKLGSKERDLIASGFYAKTPAEEIRCVDLELNVLMSIEDVTDKVNAAVKPGMGPAEANQARRAAMNTLEKESLDKTGLRSDVVTLYQGGKYHLYCFKKYTDVRLVFAPEKDIAFFGGDPDNFEYPRFDLDITYFRVYEEGKPAKIEHFLKWNPAGAGNDELIFVSGHPGRTDRMNTVAHLGFLRDLQMPHALRKLYRWEVMLRVYSERSDENARQAQDDLFGVQNSRKARLGMLAGLQDPSIIARKQADEQKLREAVKAKPDLLASGTNPWEEVSAALKVWRSMYYDWDLLENGSAFHSDLYRVARTLVRLTDESAKPNAERLREYRESNLESLKQQLFSEAPVHPDLEIALLSDSLSMLLELKGTNNPLVKKILAGKSPRERATQLVTGTKLLDVAARKQLAEGGSKAIAESKDPMIELARLIDPDARAIRKQYEEKVEEPLRQAYSKLANLRFAVYGTAVYPDATFTLRLAYGQVKGYEEQGKKVPAWTTFAGLYERSAEHKNQEPFRLPQRWVKQKDKLDLNTPFNFVSTADIIGGNSGSPVVNRKGELVGIIFDGNIQSLVLDFIYTEDQARAVSVHSSAILEALRKVYDAGALADELGR